MPPQDALHGGALGGGEGISGRPRAGGRARGRPREGVRLRRPDRGERRGSLAAGQRRGRDERQEQARREAAPGVSYAARARSAARAKRPATISQFTFFKNAVRYAFLSVPKSILN